MNNTNDTLAKRDLFDWLDDLCVRFIINLPLEELAEAERTCFQIEEAQWFYEDFIRPLDPDVLPALNLRNFYMLICQYCPILSDYPAEQHAEAFERFLKYKTRVPVRGAIMLNEAMDAVVLVKGWKKNANWSFPRGKINKEESDLACAVREVYEETGYDLEAASLVEDGEATKSIEVTMREQSLKLFVFRKVPMDTQFEPRTRKEISKIQWYKLSELPTIKKNKHQQEEKGEALVNNINKFYMVAPFLGHLKKWITQQRKLDKSNPNHRAVAHHTNEFPATTDIEDQQTEEGSGSRGNIDRLLDAHRQRKQQVQQPIPSDLPEVSQNVGSVKRAQAPTHIDTTLTADPLNKVDLLAILKGGNQPGQQPPPQTPATQMIEEPIMPHSPPHHHLSRMPTLPMAPTLAPAQSQNQELKTILPDLFQAKPIRPTTQPERLVPHARNLDYESTEVPGNVQRQVPALYKQAGNPHFPAGTSQPANQGPSIPPASNLPKPILSQQKANLLDLFKKGKATEAPTEGSTSPRVPTEIEDTAPRFSKAFVPPQIIPRPSTEKASPTQAITNQKANLLAMFKTPSTSSTAQPHYKQSSLHVPLAPVELSASPTPGHSREPSKDEPDSSKDDVNGNIVPQEQPLPAVSNKLRERSVERHKADASRTKKNDNPPVSATMNGPLNIPQFDMIARNHREAKNAAHKNGTKTEKRHLVTILSRPENPHMPSTKVPSDATLIPIAPPKAKAPPPIHSPSSKRKAAPPKQLLTPAKPVQPPTPNLEAQSTLQKAFHPQILKRPTNLVNDLNQMSPIQPLPSPKQAVPDRKSSQKIQSSNADHKKSLLSLFTAPSPAISPSAPSAGMEDSLLASLVSPVSDYPGPPQGGLERQQSWKENKATATVAGQKYESPRQTASIIALVDGKSERSPRETKPASIMAHDEQPHRRPSAKETPNELKNLLLGRLANIKV